MNSPLISVIVPVYNVEQYLDRCVESIVNQTYKNLEIILVDDGSPDNCPSMCDEWAKKDSRIKVIHKENGGLSDARNAGLDIATGEYIGFVDSDDFINENMYSVLYESFVSNNADIAECNWIKINDSSELSGSDPSIAGYDKVIYSTEDALKELILEANIKQTVVNKLYKKSIICYDFPVARINEDEFWTYRVIGNARTIVYLNVDLYYYYQRCDSIMHNKYSLNRLDGVEARKERLAYIKQNYPNLYSLACSSYLGTCFYHYQTISRNNDVDKDYKFRKMLYSEFVNYYSTDLVKSKPIKQRMWLLGFRTSPKLICSLRNTLKIGL